MAELADAPDLGSGVPDVKVQVLSGAPKIGKLSKKLADFYYSRNSLCNFKSLLIHNLANIIYLD